MEQNEDEDDDNGSDLDEEPGCDQGQAAILPIEAVVVGVEGKVVEIEEPEEHKQMVWSIKQPLEFTC